MKKISMLLVVLAMATTAFSTPGQDAPERRIAVSRTVNNSFVKNFGQASNVSWKQTDELYFAHFTLNEKEMFAAYDEKGDLVAVSKTIPFSQLPLAVSMSLKEQYADYRLGDQVIEMVLEGYTNYYLSAEGKTKNLTLKCFNDGRIDVAFRTKRRVDQYALLSPEKITATRN